MEYGLFTSFWKKNFVVFVQVVATFYRRSKFKLVHEDHRSRILITEFEPKLAEQEQKQDSNPPEIEQKNPEEEEENSKNLKENSFCDRIYIANCHLSGHPKDIEDRVCQIKSLMKQCKKRINSFVCKLVKLRSQKN